MNVLIIGSGGREHALALKIKQSPNLYNLYIMPGNPGTSYIGENVNINPSSQNNVLNFCAEKEIDLVVIGPEQPLVEGLADVLRENKFNVFGPNKAAAQIEASKAFAKEIMEEADVPTADFIEFSAKNYNLAKGYVKEKKYPCVIKADGLAAGKGVFVCNSPDEAEEALKTILLEKTFGESGEKLLVEEFLKGEEASVFAICDGESFVCLPSSQDHKRIGDNDTGKNTGGMGAYAPAPVVTPKMFEEIKNRIFAPTLKTLKKNNKPFIGCLYAGLMITNDGPKVIEFNCRFGDPETQVVLSVIEGDFLRLLYTAAIGDLDKKLVKYNGGASVCVVAASMGYPGSYKKGFEITGLDELPFDIIVYHAGTKKEDEKILTNGGRVLGVTSTIPKYDLTIAKEKAYKAMKKINFENIYYRRDIADRALNY
ncbi:MAG: phosphoribosylamine--glycine ligase [Ignavibacteria bacterium]|nr:phosphoribosylamine--glycine ligase [Ignavibacteria bacterium]MBT8381137.1 phosphoribosylamine--glycine ligase [Ignavibacteria bacterium]MBT8390982.1 phosphoribosylamine--glycine ligase [Ignavibacteria bacterium]NNJ54390.1 phosphoribosylamine--glycine ligase [Ignavibacteriaceae bacterium]NNL21702.1 phosphoribosylamine--glycine ligase [Ignavibacteriaceae bacterium]